MARLKDLVKNREPFGPGSGNETNLDNGYIWTWTQVHCSCFQYGTFWHAPGNGTATIEIWGGAGGSAQMCCCGGMVPGNAPAYSKKTIDTTSSTCVCGCIGKACSHGDALCFVGCSAASGMCYNNSPSQGNGCMCAQGGRSAVSICHENSGSAMCCLGNNGSLCITNLPGFSSGCGVVCNAPTWANASAYGGDINCQGCYSKTFFCHCNALCWHQTSYEIYSPAGMYGPDPAVFCLRSECAHACKGGAPRYSYWHSLGGIKRQPSPIQWEGSCYQSGSYCGCYEQQGCVDFWPPAMPGLGGTPCSSVRDHGSRGGHGFLKITWKPS